MNKDSQKKKMLKFLKRSNAEDIDAFCLYQWVDRCVFQGWWRLGITLGYRIPPNSLNDVYHKRLEYLLAECLANDKSAAFEHTNILRQRKSALVRSEGSEISFLTTQEKRNALLEKVRIVASQTEPGLHIGTHKNGLLRVSSGSPGIEIWLRMYPKNVLNFEIVAHHREASQTVRSLLDRYSEFIKLQTGYFFQIRSEGRRNRDYLWVFSQIEYKVNEHQEDNIMVVATDYIKIIKTLRELLQK
jgi:hypothetical protein